MTAFVPASTTSNQRASSWRTKHTRFALPATNAFPLEQQLLGNDAVQVSSSSWLAVANGSNAAPTTLPSGAVFEPVVPDSTALLAFVSIIVLSVVAVWVWANQVVPVSRTNLALSKKKGPVKDYLDELRAAAAGDPVETTTSAVATTNVTTTENNDVDMDVDEDNATILAATSSSSTTQQPKNDRALERWLFTDWLEKEAYTSGKKPGRQKEPALPVLKKAKWNSGDNPVLVASALIMAGVLFTAVTERVADVVL